MDNEVVTQYLSDLRRLLHRPARAKAAVVEAIRGGISDSAEAFTAQGLSPGSAAEAAIADFGRPAVVAAAFAGELAMAQARKDIWSLLITGPLVGTWWLLLLAPESGRFLPGGLIAAIPVLPLVAAAVVAGVLVLATSGSLIRWIPEVTPTQALLAATAIGGVCIAADAAVLVILTVRLAAGDASPPLLESAAVTASSARLLAAAWAAFRCLRTNRQLRAP
ncbi:MAG: permease prefix domain 1-containing protein [Actinomycetota bacterium]|nr:permease prefix domain 1-containing protein [Actinomycetota bacterium]